MRDMFPEYYYEPDEESLWEEAIFVFDANVLLDVYRFTPQTSKALLKILKKLKSQNRIWIPYWFALEYRRKLSAVPNEIREKQKRNKTELANKCDEIITHLKNYDVETNYDFKCEIAKIRDIFKEAKKGLSDFQQKHKSRLENYNIEAEIEGLFAGQTGEPYSDERLAEVFSEGEWRYRLQRPPGFKDSGKPESRRYGDLIGWFQIIEYAKEQNDSIPIILVTNDSSGKDWFYKPRGQNQNDEEIKVPHPELVKEMRDKASVDFYLYQTGDFMELAEKHLALDEPITDGAITEAKKTRRNVDLSNFDWLKASVAWPYNQQVAQSLAAMIPKSTDSLLAAMMPQSIETDWKLLAEMVGQSTGSKRALLAVMEPQSTTALLAAMTSQNTEALLAAMEPLSTRAQLAENIRNIARLYSVQPVSAHLGLGMEHVL